MRRMLLLVVGVLLPMVLVAPAAMAIPEEPKGCPAEASVWTLVSFGAENYKDDSFYTFYFVTYSEAAEALAAYYGYDLNLPDEEAAVYDIAVEAVASIDFNGDLQFCTFWLGGNPGKEDYWISVIDNRSNANH